MKPKTIYCLTHKQDARICLRNLKYNHCNIIEVIK